MNGHYEPHRAEEANTTNKDFKEQVGCLSFIDLLLQRGDGLMQKGRDPQVEGGRDAQTRGTARCLCGLGLLRALDSADAWYAPQSENHAIEVVHVFCLDNKLDDGFFVLGLADVDAADVGVVVRDDGG